MTRFKDAVVMACCAAACVCVTPSLNDETTDEFSSDEI